MALTVKREAEEAWGLGQLDREEVIRIGQEIYERDLKAQFDTPENQGRLVALDIRSGDYLMGGTRRK